METSHPQAQYDIVALNYPRQFKTGSQAFQATAIPADHCPGSCMWFFEFDLEHTHTYNVLYTGDFRWNPRRSLPSGLCKVYYDDTFESYPVSFPSYQNTYTQLLNFLDSRDPSQFRPWIDCRILGIETLLRAVSKATSFKYCLSPALLKNTIRQNQIKFLLNGHLISGPAEMSRVITLGDNNRDTQDGQSWLLPSITYTLCPNRPLDGNFQRMEFATHSSQSELIEFKAKVSRSSPTVEFTALGFNVHPMRCNLINPKTPLNPSVPA